jgi:hypothetical protein
MLPLQASLPEASPASVKIAASPPFKTDEHNHQGHAERPQAKAGQMTATTKCRNVEIVLAMWVSSTDAQVLSLHHSASFCISIEGLCKILHRFAEAQRGPYLTVSLDGSL